MTIEELQEQILQMQDELKQVKEEKQTLDNINQENINKINDLQNMNQKLFLRVTKEQPLDNEIKEEDKTEMAIKDFVGEKIYNVLSNKDKELAKIILEGEDE